MFSSAEKTTKPAIAVQQKAAGTSFFKKAGEEGFFGAKESPAFINNPVQAKLTVSSPDDPQEKEADAVAEKVMRMEEPIMAAPVTDKKEEKLQKQEEEKETVQTKPLLPSAPLIQRKEAPEQKLQAKLFSTTQILARKAAVQQGTLGQSSDAAMLINRKSRSVFQSDVVQRSGRGSPSSAVPFDKALAASKGGGTAMSGSTKQFMESRFQADFSGVRIHTGPAAEHLSSSIQAQAFAHGNDIYFNQNKYSPDSSAGRTLLAHELTHTIQQGASKSNVAPTRGSPTVAPKKSILHQPIDRIPLPLKLMPEIRAPEKLKSNLAEKAEIHQKEDSELKKQSLPETGLVQPKTKTELNPWAVSPKGQLQPAGKGNTTVSAVNLVPAVKPVVQAQPVVAKTTDAKEIKSEENSREKERVPENSTLALQKKPVADNLPNITTQGDVQTKYISLATSLNQVINPHVPYISPFNQSVFEFGLTPRGPPLVQRNPASGEGVVQCALYDDALARISSLLELPSVTEILDFDPIAWLRGKVRQFASYIPGYRALGVILGADPITGEEIPRNGRNFLEAGLDIIPGGNLLKQKLDQLGILDRAAGWIDTQIDTVIGIVRGVTTEFNDAWNALTASSILDGPTAIVRRFGDILERGLNNIIDFARRAGSELLKIVKDFLLSHIVTFVKEHTTAYELLKVILEQDPITEEPVARNGTNILNALLELGGEEGREQRRQMQETGTFQKAADHIDRGIAVFSGLYNTIRSGFDSIWSEISIESLMNPVETFNRIYAKFEAPVQQVLDFVRDTLAIILGFIKEALMGRLSAWASTIRGYRLITVIINKDPFTNAVVPRTVENIIRGFMSLMEGGEEQFNQLQESGAIGRAVQRIDAAVARLNMTPEYVVQLFTQLWNSFSFADLADPIAAFQRIMDQFGEPIGRLVAFVVEIVRIVVEVVMQVMNFPSDLIANIISRAMQAFEMIKQDPVGFLKNLLRAIKQGFIQFFENIGQHLLGGLQGWLMSELGDAGVQAPQDFTLRGIITWVLDLLGITMEKIWEKLAQHRRIGPERVTRIRGMINQLEGIWTFIKDVQERGMAAIWEKIQERLSSLWDTILDAVKNWVMEQIVNRITARLLTMLDPTGIMAVINGAIALYSAVQSFIRYLREMLQIVNSFVEGVVQIASGDVSVAANFLERAMARGVPIMIGFLANQVGLSGLGSRIGEMISRVREMVDEAITWLVNRAVDTGMALLDRVMAMGRSAVGAIMGFVRRLLGIEKRFQGEDGANHRLYFAQQGSDAVLMLNPAPAGTYQRWVNTIETEPGSRKEQKKNQAITKAQQIDLEKATAVTGTGAQLQAAEEAKAERIRGLMDELSALTGPLFAGELPNCAAEGSGLTFGGLRSSKYGTQMIAEYLTKIRMPGGSVPSVAHHQSYAIINQRRNQGGSYYILGHLLNHNLGGTGRDWKNLTPLTREANRAHEHIAEARVKNAVNAGNKVFYKVEAQYGRAIPSGGGNGTIREIMQEEAHVPLRLICHAEMVTPAEMSTTGRGARTPLVPAGTVIENNVSQRPEDYDLTGIRRETIYLNSGNVEHLNSIDGVDRPLAQKIVDAWRDKGRNEGTRFATFTSLATYVFSDGRTFTPRQQTIINTLPDYVCLYRS